VESARCNVAHSQLAVGLEKLWVSDRAAQKSLDLLGRTVALRENTIERIDSAGEKGVLKRVGVEGVDDAIKRAVSLDTAANYDFATTTKPTSPTAATPTTTLTRMHSVGNINDKVEDLKMSASKRSSSDLFDIAF